MTYSRILSELPAIGLHTAPPGIEERVMHQILKLKHADKAGQGFFAAILVFFTILIFGSIAAFIYYLQGSSLAAGGAEGTLPQSLISSFVSEVLHLSGYLTTSKSELSDPCSIVCSFLCFSGFQKFRGKAEVVKLCNSCYAVWAKARVLCCTHILRPKGRSYKYLIFRPFCNPAFTPARCRRAGDSM